MPLFQLDVKFTPEDVHRPDPSPRSLWPPPPAPLQLEVSVSQALVMRDVEG